MKINTLNIFLFVAVAMLLPACSGNNVPSLKESFSRADNNPFGTYVAFRQVNEFFYRNDVRVKKEGIEKALQGYYSDTAAVFISICKNFYLRKGELSSLLEYAERGNNVFVSASRFDSSLLESVGLTGSQSAFSTAVSFLFMKQTKVNLAPPYYPGNPGYDYYFMPFGNSFMVNDPGNIRVLGTNENGEPNFVVAFYGKGRVYLHCEPRAFSNYFLLQKENYKYLQQAFSFMPAVPDNIFWDDYYNKRNLRPAANDAGGNSKSGLTVLLKYPPLAWAFLLTLLLLLLYILFGGKRRQRIIKPTIANENTSVAFTETVALLYLQEKDNRNIAEKMATFFLEHIRSQYFINTNNLNDEFTTMLSRKSDVPLEQTEELIGIIKRVQRYDDVDDALLLSLNKKIENFYKHKR